MSSSVPAPLFSRTSVWIPIVGLLLAAFGAWSGDILRHELIEPVERAAACTGGAGAWWCPIRTGIRIAAQNYLIAGAALMLAVAALASRGRPAAAAVLVALFLGGAGLYLYSAGLSAVAVVLALLRAAALDRG